MQDRPHAQKFRDGLPYQHNLAAVRAVMDASNRARWDSNIYMGWLACLRELSAPTTDAKYPEAMRTRAWAMKTLNTQLASWTQLRHDTILYAKQSWSAGCACFLSVRLCRATGRVLATLGGDRNTCGGPDSLSAL